MKKIITTTLAFMALITISSCSNDVESSLIQREFSNSTRKSYC